MVDEKSPAALIVPYLKIRYNVIGDIALEISNKIYIARLKTKLDIKSI